MISSVNVAKFAGNFESSHIYEIINGKLHFLYSVGQKLSNPFVTNFPLYSIESP